MDGRADLGAHELAGEEGPGGGRRSPAVARHRRRVGAGAGADPRGDIAVPGLVPASDVAAQLPPRRSHWPGEALVVGAC